MQNNDVRNHLRKYHIPDGRPILECPHCSQRCVFVESKTEKPVLVELPETWEFGNAYGQAHQCRKPVE